MPPAPPKEQVKAPDGEGCPRCGLYVYAAEKMLGRENVSQSITGGDRLIG